MQFSTTREPADTYHAHDVFQGGRYLSSHALLEFIESPVLYKEKLDRRTLSKDSDAYRIGRAAHCRILEGRETYRQRYCVGGPINEKTGACYGTQTQAYTKWRAEQQAQGRDVLSSSEDNACESMAAAINNHAEARDMLSRGCAEQVARAKYCGMDCQIKINWLTDDALVHLKTCRDIKRFVRDFYEFRYHNQLSFYQKVLESFASVRLPVYVIAVEKVQPFRTAFFRVDQRLLDTAQLENESAIHRLRECTCTGVWPTGYEGVRVIQPTT